MPRTNIGLEACENLSLYHLQGSQWSRNCYSHLHLKIEMCKFSLFPTCLGSPIISCQVSSCGFHRFTVTCRDECGKALLYGFQTLNNTLWRNVSQFLLQSLFIFLIFIFLSFSSFSHIHFSSFCPYFHFMEFKPTRNSEINTSSPFLHSLLHVFLCLSSVPFPFSVTFSFFFFCFCFLSFTLYMLATFLPFPCQ
jgi:hypothetical protein